MSDRTIIQILEDHQLGFMGTCVDRRGAACSWKANRRRGNFGTQHRQHLADLISEATRCP